MVGERPLSFSANGAGNQADTLVRASDGAGPANDASSRLSPRVCRVVFTSDGTATLQLRTAPSGAAADTNFLIPVICDGHPFEWNFEEGTADVPVTRDLYYNVTAGGGVNWSFSAQTVMR